MCLHLYIPDAAAQHHSYVSSVERLQYSKSPDGDCAGGSQPASGALQALSGQRARWTDGHEGHDAVRGVAQVLADRRGAQDGGRASGRAAGGGQSVRGRP